MLPSDSPPQPSEHPEHAPTTGRFIVEFDEEVAAAEVLRADAGMADVADSRDLRDSAEGVAPDAQATVFSELGLAVVAGDPDQMTRLQTAPDQAGAVLAVWPELIHHVLPGSDAYARGYRDGVSDLSDRLSGGGASAAGDVDATFADDAAATWGLQACGVLASEQSGAGIRVAVLDTGFDLAHPDFVGRTVTAQSFVSGEPPDDGHGHGTHCIGTSCGPQDPSQGPRYGVAYEADIFVGKVLSNSGSGSDGGILAGIDWAVANDCHIVSMSLGANVRDPHRPYTTAGRRALNRGTLIIAAAGNNANRPSDPGFVGAPANSPQIMAVGALDSQLEIARFSARSSPGRGGQVDIAGPGVAVYSAWPMPQRYHTISGTSMATPHVAGLAALWAESTGYRARALWSSLAQFSQRLPLPSVDVGGGLGYAPR